LVPAGEERRLQGGASGSCSSAEPEVNGVGPGSLPEEAERLAIAIRFRNVSRVNLGLEVEKGCGHTFLFAAKACVSGKCDPCSNGAGCAFGEWEEWGPCTKSCGGGEKVRSRDVIPVDTRGRNGGDCRGPTKVARSCNLMHCIHNCTPVNCEWGKWAPWGACASTVGQRHRNRAVLHQASCGGQACVPGDEAQIEPCERAGYGGSASFCVWGDWEQWSQCDKSCGCGRKERQRSLHTAHGTPEVVAKFAASQGIPSNRSPGSLAADKPDFQAVGVAFFAGCFSILGVLLYVTCRRQGGRRRPSSTWQEWQESTQADLIAEEEL